MMCAPVSHIYEARGTNHPSACIPTLPIAFVGRQIRWQKGLAGREIKRCVRGDMDDNMSIPPSNRYSSKCKPRPIDMTLPETH